VASTTTPDGRTYSQVVEQRLTPLLGPFTARMALKTFGLTALIVGGFFGFACLMACGFGQVGLGY